MADKKVEKVEFIQYHRPALDDGDYQITVTQTIKSGKIPADEKKEFTTTRHFTVAGERFALKPADIHAVFPPAGSLGDHSNVLPHIVFNRSTLPWERKVEANSPGVPWLALLLFEEGEKLNGTIQKQAFLEKLDHPQGEQVWNHLLDEKIGWLKETEKDSPQAIMVAQANRASKTLGDDFAELVSKIVSILDQQSKTPQILTLKDLKAPSTGDLKWPDLQLESGQHEDDKVTVIDVEKRLLAEIMPTKEDLAYLAHVRQTILFSLEEKFQYELDDRTISDDLRNEFKKHAVELSQTVIVSIELEGRKWTLTDGDTQAIYYIEKDEDKHELNICGQQVAVVIGNRLPKSGGASTVHLVSVEGRYKDGSFDYQGAGDDDLIRLVSLKSWRFACLDEESFEITSHSLEKLKSEGIPDDVQRKLESLKNQEVIGKGEFLKAIKAQIGDEQTTRYQSLILRYALAEKLSFKGLLTHLNREPGTLRLPKSDHAEAEKYLAMGYVPVPHHLRQGSKTVSWYHGPLTTGENPSDIVLPVRAADELVRYNPANGMFDVSYAAAWELGRLLALQSKPFSISLYNWKRTHAQQLAQAEQQLIPPHLPAYGQQATTTSDALEIPKGITDWFWRLSLMQGVPFNYLVPDERMLPKESIRFFMVDPLWVDCLLDGAFSIGRVTGADHERDSNHVNSPAANRHEKVSGLLLRSDVVAGWPGLLVDAYDEIIDHDDFDPDQDRLEMLRMDRLSANVLICLFDGEVKTVDIHQKPETLHFGLDERDDATGYEKKLRDSEGNLKEESIQIPWKKVGGRGKRVIDITELKTAIETAPDRDKFTSAQFALEMIEGVEKVRFSQKRDSVELVDERVKGRSPRRARKSRR